MEESVIATIVAGILGGIGIAFRRWRRRRRDRLAAKALDDGTRCPSCKSIHVEHSVDEDGASMTQCYTCGGLFVREPK